MERIIMVSTVVVCLLSAIHSHRTMKKTIDAYTAWMVKKEREWAHLRSRIDAVVRNASTHKKAKQHKTYDEITF